MDKTKKLIDGIKRDIGNIKKGGTMKFWDEWFGRPMDNYHSIKEINYDEQEDKLLIKFDMDELLTIVEPGGIKINNEEFSIRNARIVRWEWHSHGKPNTLHNYYYINYQKNDHLIEYTKGKLDSEYIEKRILKFIGQMAVEIC